MADILIRGIEYPQCCGECPFQASRWTGDFCSAGQFMIGMDYDPRDKHEKCPLIEIETPHGRLIDADVMVEGLMKCAKNPPYDDQMASWFYLFAAEIAKACPTIIEAEGATE